MAEDIVAENYLEELVGELDAVIYEIQAIVEII